MIQLLPSQIETQNSGYTLVEVVVALVLLVTVLIPTAAALVFLAQRPDIPHRMEALAHAQSAMERALSEPPQSWQSVDETDGVWRTTRTVVYTENLATVTVSVYRTASESPIATLTTARFVVPEEVE